MKPNTNHNLVDETDSRNFKIDNRNIGDNHPTFVIAEVAQAHDGSLGQAHAFIDAVASTGADAIKFQTHIAEHETTIDEPWRIEFSFEDSSRFDYWKRMEFSIDQWRGLKQHCDEKGLIFLSSPFSVEAAELLNDIGMPAWKVASGELSNSFLHDYIATCDKPVILSTGLSNETELKSVIDFYKSKSIPTAILQCATEYPCPAESVGLNVMAHYKNLFECATGLSDHSANIYTGIAAATLDAGILEVHVCLSPWMFGPDTPASLTIEQLKEMIIGIRHIERLKAHPVDKAEYLDKQSRNISIFNKSLIAAQDIAKNTIITKHMLTAKKPGTGISVSRVGEIQGKTATRNISSGSFISFEDF